MDTDLTVLVTAGLTLVVGTVRVVLKVRVVLFGETLDEFTNLE